ncbi:MAG: dihydropteroate synthase [Candidatus Fermentibacteraceae bacterium]
MQQVRPVLLESRRHWLGAMEELGCDPEAWLRVRERSDVVALLTGPIRSPAASILKQAMLAAGADALVHRLVLTCGVPESAVLIYGPPKNVRAGCDSLRGQPFGLDQVADEILGFLQVPDAPDTIVLGDKSLTFGPMPLFMGVLNFTPDSFSDGGQWQDPAKAVEHGLAMHEQGASIVDVGGESTRPGSRPTSRDEQLERVIPVISGLSRKSDVLISVDTVEPEVARAALAAGARIINSVNGMESRGMAELAAETGAGVIVMHMRGDPATMQQNPRYSHAPSEIALYLLNRVNELVEAGVERSRIMVDPGIGFGKRPWDNLGLINSAPWLRRVTGCRIVLGHSRKSFLGLLSGETEPARRDSASALVSALSADRVDILRVHNVKQCSNAVSAALEGIAP